ncbi:HAMP domain-containing sensor histidine kinase [Methylocaldum sp.]|uniref:sensor histidine kinase n=1 Tax=Methylocaldum sp. TaxID=1969727 RepID=UPI002D31F8A3|nr:HAMP domain-containing sensor histidine kinase [Methylocaldum sp.]HYE33961.1 HAMP domain-containing sensor histidine kinase [Methylocaldum sp.]
MSSSDTSRLDGRMPESEHTREIRAAQTRLLYQQVSSGLIATVVNATILVLILWKEVSEILLTGWLLTVGVVVLGRYGLLRAYLQANPTSVDSPRWARLFLLGVAANGALWGLAGFFLFVEQSYVHQIFLGFMLGGMVAGAMSTLSSFRGAFLVFLLPALLPYTLQVLRHGEDVHLAMGAMLLLFVVMMWTISERLYATVAESLQLRFDNLDLLGDLTWARDRQKIINQELSAQIAEKQRAQRELQEACEKLEQRVRERTEKLARSEEALRDANRRKDEFLAMLGHELRNPLAPIRNAVKIMRKTGMSEPRLDWARDIIDRQVDHLARLVDDLLDVSRIVQGKISLHATTLDLATAINQAVEASRPLIEARHHELFVTMPEGRLQVKGDQVRLAQVISNLLNNAAKYTDTGGKIWLTAEASRDRVSIRVRDNGVGIPEKLLSHIFDLFTQADQSLARAQGGLGIGLTLVKRLVEMHGGEVEAQSPGPGQGSEFSIHLPRFWGEIGQADAARSNAQGNA